MNKILYICMPFASVAWGSLGLSTLKAIGQQAGIESDICYLNIPFAQTMGESRYNKLREVISAELCFTATLFPDITPTALWEQYLCLPNVAQTTDTQTLAQLERDFIEIVAQFAPQLLDRAIATICWDDYDIIGFTTGYHQTVASLALAQRIRYYYPQKIILFGGAACDGEMGPTLLQHFEMIDVVVSGEADLVLVPLIQALRNQEPVNQWPEIYGRASERVVIASPFTSTLLPTVSEGTEKVDMNALPIPNYDDYFAQIATIQMADIIRIPFESSRGCWWGQKHLCSFCGLNSDTLTYRSKAPEKVIEELHTQYSRYGQTHFLAADNIFSMAYFNTFLPSLQSLHEALGLTIFYEVKANLREEQIHALRTAGVTEVQPGIESFSDHILQLMDKGTTGLNQVRFVRDCASHGIETRYGILWGNPGETADDYLGMMNLIPFICHLPPPDYIVPVSLERFSRYFTAPEQFGIHNIRPAPIYHVMFGGRPIDYAKLAYVFHYEHESDKDSVLNTARAKFYDNALSWKTNYKPHTLISTVIDDVLYIADQRASTPKLLRLFGIEKDFFLFCYKPRTANEIERAFPEHPFAWWQPIIEQMHTRRLLLVWPSEYQPRYMSLPVCVSTNCFYQEGLMPITSLSGVE